MSGPSAQRLQRVQLCYNTRYGGHRPVLHREPRLRLLLLWPGILRPRAGRAARIGPGLGVPVCARLEPARLVRSDPRSSRVVRDVPDLRGHAARCHSHPCGGVVPPRDAGWLICPAPNLRHTAPARSREPSPSQLPAGAGHGLCVGRRCRLCLVALPAGSQGASGRSRRAGALQPGDSRGTARRVGAAARAPRLPCPRDEPVRAIAAVGCARVRHLRHHRPGVRQGQHHLSVPNHQHGLLHADLRVPRPVAARVRGHRHCPPPGQGAARLRSREPHPSCPRQQGAHRSAGRRARGPATPRGRSRGAERGVAGNSRRTVRAR